MAARDFRIPIDMHQLEVREAVAHLLGSAPGTPVEGQFYWNTTTHTIDFWNGSAWLIFGTLDQINAPAADVSLNSHKITALANPTTGTDATNRQYVLGLTPNDLAALIADYSMAGHKLTSLGNGTASGDAVNKGQLDAAVLGLSWKTAVRAATNAAGTLGSSFANGSTIDTSVTLVTGDRILIKDQAAPAENGIYTVNASGAPTRSTDANTAALILQATVSVEEGTVNADTAWQLTTNAPITLGTTGLTFARLPGVMVAGNGLTVAGNTVSVVAGAGIIADGTSTRVDTSIVAERQAFDIGDGSTTSIVVTHSLPAGKDHQVTVYDKTTPFSEQYPEVRHTSTTTDTLVFAVAPTTAQYRAVLVG